MLNIWVYKFVARLLATAAVWVLIQISLKKQKRRHKQRSSQHTLARQKIYKKIFPGELVKGAEILHQVLKIGNEKGIK